MDFAALPPEINSDRMYSGPGPASLLTAATAWDTLATEHTTLADTYSSVIADLTTAGWRGPTSTMMANAATPLVAWLHNTARLAAQTATQLTAAVGAYETALAATVPPPLVAANRAKLLALIKTNFFGQNSPAIAGVEAHYEEMWAQDATAMYGYRSAAACATRLTPFSQPPQVTNPNGSSAQAAAAAQAVAAGAGHAKDISALPGLTDGLGGLGPPSAAAGSSGLVPVIAGEPVSAYAITGGVRRWRSTTRSGGSSRWEPG